MRISPEIGLEKLMDAYTGYAYTIVKNKLEGICSADDIEECVADVFFNVYQMRKRLDVDNTSLKALVSIVARRRAIDVMRRYSGSQKRNFSLEDMPGEKMISNEIEEDIVKSETRSQLIKEIKALGEPDSEILVRKYFFGQSSKEMSRALGMKVNTIDKRVSRALIKLRQRMKGVF